MAINLSQIETSILVEELAKEKKCNSLVLVSIKVMMLKSPLNTKVVKKEFYFQKNTTR